MRPEPLRRIAVLSWARVRPLFALALCVAPFVSNAAALRPSGLVDVIYGDGFEFTAPLLGSQENPALSCRDVQLNRVNPPLDGTYYVVDGAATAAVPCDMTLDGGGWTASFQGLNGSTNVFDHFDAGVYSGAQQNPTGLYLRRPPGFLDTSAAELAVSCGNASVAFALTEASRKWLRAGVQGDWVAVTPRLLTGTVPNLPNSLWTGVLGNPSFIVARNQGGGANTFGSSYQSNTAFNYCNGVLNTSSALKVLVREVDPTPVLNTPAAARHSCETLRAAGATQSGVYWLQQTPAPAYKAYCEMNLAGGGWTSVFSGRNGRANVFDAFDAGVYLGTCPDPASRCLVRAPTTLGDSATEVAVSCGSATVSFALTQAARSWLQAGTKASWIPVTPQVLAGSVPNVPNGIFTGGPGDAGFIVARDQGSGANAFASSYPGSDSFSYCNGVFDAVSFTRIYYREALVEPPLNAQAQAGASCKALRTAGATTDGSYWVQNPPGATVVAYCDMSHDGGGWTAIFAGRNGSQNVFDRFDTGSHVGTCTDPQTRCLRRAPAALATGSFAVSCGAAFVKFPATPAMSAYFTSGTQVDWTPVTPTVVAGSVANAPNSLFTGSGATRGWIFARNNSGGGNTFAQSFDTGTAYDYCNGIFDNSTITRIYVREP